MPEVDVEESVDLAAHHAALRRKFLAGLLLYTIIGQLANVMLAGFQSPTLQLLGVMQLALISAAWIWELPRIQLGVIAALALYAVAGCYAWNFIPAL
jgi:hypothetical protein